MTLAVTKLVSGISNLGACDFFFSEGTLKVEYELETEYEYDFSNPVCGLWIIMITCQTNFVSRVFLSAGKLQERIGDSCEELTRLKFKSCARIQI